MAKKSEKQPSAVRMTRPHGFIDDNEVHRQWNQGEIVRDKDDIALLMERGAEFEEVQEEKEPE